MYAGLHIYIMPIPRGIAPSESSFSPQTMEIDYDPPICKNMVIVVGSWLTSAMQLLGGVTPGWLANGCQEVRAGWLAGRARMRSNSVSCIQLCTQLLSN
jgi:hypothetical protein